MKKGNIIRVVVWGSICVALLGFGAIGFFSFKNGYGDVGSVVKYTSKLVDTFNNLSEVKKYNVYGINIKAKVKDDTIVVDYATSVISASFVFNYQLMTSENGEARVISTTYSNSSQVEKEAADKIVSFMIDAASVLNGKPEGMVFDKYELSNFESSTILDGVLITRTIDKTNAYINISKSVLDSVIVPTQRDTLFANENDLAPMMEELASNKIFILTKNTLNLVVTNNDTSYTVYAQDSSLSYTSDLYESIKNVIKILKGAETLDIFVANYPVIQESSNFDKFTVTVDTMNATDFVTFDKKDKIIQIDILL